LNFGDLSIPGVVTSLGFGFATNSYSKTGLAIVQGSNDIMDLVGIYAEIVGEPEKVFLTGASEGGIITTLLIEQYPDIFEAGLALCGPVGDFPFQINYFGDARATFQVFFPYLIPGDPFDPPQWLVDNWKDYYDTVVKPKVLSLSNRDKLDQWVRVANLPFDAENYLETVEVSVQDVLRYAVVNLKDAAATLGGFPFENRWKWYQGSKNDFQLNLIVPRRNAHPDALAEMKTNYNTAGELARPLITMHTLRDQQIPYIHEVFYNLKTISRGSFLTEHINIPIDRFEHCNFTPQEALLSFGLMLLYAGDLDTLSGIGTILQGDGLQVFENMAKQYGLPYNIEGEELKALRK
jgi:pimeloyl-ACP methyl ester carboxylesterase